MIYIRCKINARRKKMQIHTTSQNETVAEIAEKYTVSEDNIRNINSLGEDEAAVGEELLILIPTRSYTVQYGDTPERIALRFGVAPADITAMNPWTMGRELEVGEEIALKYDGRPYGMSAANGYFYKGCTEDDFNRAMPYLTYITFASAVADKRRISLTFDDRKYVTEATERHKIPLIRVHDRHTGRYDSKDGLDKYAEELIALALSGGYKGIVIDTCSISDKRDIFCEFLVELRKRMLGCDLILITEINEGSPTEYSEYADGSVFYYPKYAMENPPSFEDGEKRLLSDFACAGESAKVFIDLPSLAMCGSDFCHIDKALKAARRRGMEIKQNKSTLLSHCGREQGEYSFTSLTGIRELFGIINEYGYMGICFDIMRTPLSHIMMYNSLFKTSYYTNVRSREGCSRAVEG